MAREIMSGNHNGHIRRGNQYTVYLEIWALSQLVTDGRSIFIVSPFMYVMK